jgi:hypothetical protein
MQYHPCHDEKQAQGSRPSDGDPPGSRFQLAGTTLPFANRRRSSFSLHSFYSIPSTMILKIE